MNDNGLLDRFFIDREQRYKDYAEHECKQANLEREWEDLYMEVMASFFEKREQAIALINKHVEPTTKKNKKLIDYYKKNGNQFPLCEFDFFFLRCIKLNTISERAPYRWTYHRQPKTDANADYSRIEIEDDIYIETYDPSQWVIEQTERIRTELNTLGIGELGQRVFAFKFLDGNSLKDWKGPESKKELYHLYRETMRLLKSKLNPNYLSEFKEIQLDLF